MTRHKLVPSALSDLSSLKDGILSDILLGPPPKGLNEEAGSKAQDRFYVHLTIDGRRCRSHAIQHLLALGQNPLRIGTTVRQDRPCGPVEDIRAARKFQKLVINCHFQGSEAVGRDLANVGAYYKLGVRWMLMAYNFQNNVGTGCLEAEKNDIGISQFGKELIAEMNRVGMLVDCSHSGYRTTMDAMSISTKPCIFSHSNPRALYDHPRNIRDDQIKRCAQTEGVIDR
ncbi:MAG: membrane dipeptidase [Steroidobacteraceae bacterium]